jgi:hypothetical protein
MIDGRTARVPAVKRLDSRSQLPLNRYDGVHSANLSKNRVSRKQHNR